MKKILAISILLNIAGLIVGLFAVNRLGGFAYFMHKIKNGGLSAVYENRKDLFERLPNETEEIIFLGDSITEGGEWSELFSNLNVKNRGISGDVIEGVIKRLEEVVSSNPKKIFLMIGLNNLIFHKPDQIAPLYKDLVQQITEKSPNTVVYLQSILPINDVVRNTVIDNNDILEINKDIQKTATEFGLEYIDLHSIFKNKDGQLKKIYTVDGVHLNGAAYLHWKNAIIDKMN